jgi:hypothetical protein
MHPIHYSMILNLVAWGISGWLAIELREPLVFIVVYVLTQHAVSRFDEVEGPQGEYDGGSGAGFHRQ